MGNTVVTPGCDAVALNPHPIREGSYVLYWMQAAQRIRFNPALSYAADLANSLQKPLLVCFCLKSDVPGAALRHYSFMLEGIRQVSGDLEEKGIAFALLPDADPDCLAEKAVAAVVDCGHLRWQRDWRMRMGKLFSCRLLQVETNSAIPVDVLSGKEEYAAYGIRGKLHRMIASYIPHREDALHMTVRAKGLRLPAPALRPLPATPRLLALLHVGSAVTPVTAFTGGENEAWRRLRSFVADRLPAYGRIAGDPAHTGCSELSPYLHFGQISPLAIAREVLAFCSDAGWPPARNDGKASDPLLISRDAFLEQLLVRRELAINFVTRNLRYDAYASLPAWAKNTLRRHAGDARPQVYSEKSLENAETHDIYWNAAQRELLQNGHMHNYMRMYWGKKVIEWSPDPETAFEILIRLNDKYQLDGRDANGYAGVAWCFGKHDRPWRERPIFGMVRYMNAAGLRRKFAMEDYVARIMGDTSFRRRAP